MSKQERAEEASFDQVLGELAQIVESLEQSDLPLERSLEIFERGVVLSRSGQRMLDEAERRIEVLLNNGELEAMA